MSTLLQFSRATKKQLHLRLALAGGPGSGKTFSALSIAEGLPGPVALLDTESRSASKYADRFTFDVLELEDHSPGSYVQAIEAAVAAGYRTLIIDSFSHAWMGTNGVLEQLDRMTNGNKNFSAWAKLTPQHNALVRAILSAPIHVIATMRTKMEYAVEAVDGKLTPRKVGLAPVQRDGVEFEFDIVADLSQDNVAVVTKSRCAGLPQGRAIVKPGRDVGVAVMRWLEAGQAPVVLANEASPPAPSPAPPRWEQPHHDPTPGRNVAMMTQTEQYNVERLAPRFVEAKTHAEVRNAYREAIRVSRGPSASEAYQRWAIEMRKQAEAALGPEPTLAPPVKAPAPPAGAQMPTQRAVTGGSR